MHPEDELLAALALGEAVTPPDEAHVAACAVCSAVVTELRDLAARVGPAVHEELTYPSDAVWQRIAAALDDDAGFGRTAAPASAIALAALSPADPDGSGPDGVHRTEKVDGVRLRAVPAAPVTQPAADEQPGGAAPAEAPEESDELAARRRPRLGWLLGAVAAGVAIGVVGAQVPNWVAPPTVLARAALDTLDTNERRGEAELVQGRDQALDLRVQVEQLPAGTGYLEVWLINTDLTRMVSVGVLPDQVASDRFRVTQGLIDAGYTIVDISREPLDDKPQHSGQTLARGALI